MGPGSCPAGLSGGDTAKRPVLQTIRLDTDRSVAFFSDFSFF
jgi:hypothetical protein